MAETISMIAGVLGGIVLLGNVGVVISRWISPAIKQKDLVEEHSRQIAALEEHEQADLERLEHLQEMNKLQLQSLICLLNHMIDGNGVDKMKETREDIQELLIKY